MQLGKIDFIIGGPPCQSFSAAGRRAGGVFGINDLRGTLFWHYCRLLDELKPKGFLFENVRGILSANSKGAWEIIQKSFADLGYKLFHRVLDAAEYGVPQHRDRVILVGLRDAESFLFPHPTHGPASHTGKGYYTASQAIADLQDKDEKYVPYGGKYEELMLGIPPGMNYLFYTEKMEHPEPKFAWRSRFSDFLYIADPDQPTRTIVAHPGKWAGPFHWKRRRFTIAELKRLFTFPDDYSLVGSEATQIRQLGNSVAPALAYKMAQAVKSQVFGDKNDVALASNDLVFDLDSRKGRRARVTRKRVKTNSELFEGSQMDLFRSNSVTPKKALSLKWDYHFRGYRYIVDIPDNEETLQKFHCVAELKDGSWSVKVTCSNPKNFLRFDLSFVKVIQDSFDRIKVEMNLPNPEWLGVGWEAVNYCVKESTSYENIHKLYGHFTEPYPQFKIDFESDCSQCSICRFQKHLCDYSYLSGYHDLDQLKKFWPGKPRDLSKLAMELRSIGYDVRTNETNRTVPEGRFRICYPFTIPLDAKNFVRWREKGTHQTADRTSLPDGRYLPKI